MTTKDEALKQALDALIWTTGSGDFADGGQAREGAVKCLFPAIAACREALAQKDEQEPVADGLPLVIAGAIYDFAGYLTTRNPAISVGATKNAAPIVEHITTWAELHGLQLDDADVYSWHFHLHNKPIKRKPMTEDEIADIWNTHCDAMRNVSIEDAEDIARAIEQSHGIGEQK